MEFITPAVRLTADGSPTLVSPDGDTYHSVNGAVAESLHVFIRNGLDLCPPGDVSILEAGLGSGLNAWLTAREGERTGRRISYTAVELYPVDPEAVAGDGFPDDDIFRTVHRCPWGSPQRVSELFTLTKLNGDLAKTVFDVKFDLVYFDMFAPDTAAHLWTEGIFRRVGAAMDRGGAIVTYCVKGDVKRALRAAGFEVRRLPGAPGKRHMLRAVKL